MQQWKFDDPDAILNIGSKRIVLPIPDVLYQQNIAAFQLGSAGLVQVLLQRDKMIFHVQAVIELARARQRFVNCLSLAVADDQNPRSLRRNQEGRRLRRQAFSPDLVQADRADSEVGIAQMQESE